MSTDGGVQWKQYLYNGGDMSAALDAPTKLCVKGSEIYLTARTRIDGNNYSGSAVILKSTDWGKTWGRHFLPFKKWIYDMKFINDSTALVSGAGGLLFKWNTKQALFTSVGEITIMDAIAVYPNPTSDFITVSARTHLVVNIDIYNTFGEIVKQEKRNVPAKIDLTSLAPGIYFLNIDDGISWSHRKVLKY
jgi:hypothetical protein